MKTALELPDGPRRPDGVTLPEEPLVPQAAERAPAAGVVALKPRLSDAAIRAAVDRFFDVFARHDGDGLDALLSRSARLIDARSGSTYAALREELRGRIHALEAAGLRAVRVESIERFDRADLEGLPEGGPPALMRPGDVLVRVHVSVPQAAGARVFAPVVVLLWREEEDPDVPASRALRVAGYDEEDAASSASTARSAPSP